MTLVLVETFRHKNDEHYLFKYLLLRFQPSHIINFLNFFTPQFNSIFI